MATFNLREEILAEHSKAKAMKITAWIGKDAKRFAQLMHLFLNDEYRVVQRAAYAVSMVGDKHPEMMKPYLAEMVERMQQPGLHVAVKRNVVRLLQHLQIPEALHGEVMNICFDLLADPKETIAVRAFSMTVLANLAKEYPEIKQELKTIIESELEQNPSPAFQSRAKKILNTK